MMTFGQDGLSLADADKCGINKLTKEKKIYICQQQK